MHICVGKLTSIASDNGLSPRRRQAIIWNIVGIMLIGPLGTNFSEILIEIQTFIFIEENTFENAVYEMSVILSLPQCVNNADCRVPCISLIPWSQVCSHMNIVLRWGYWTLLNKIQNDSNLTPTDSQQYTTSRQVSLVSSMYLAISTIIYIHVYHSYHKSSCNLQHLGNHWQLYLEIGKLVLRIKFSEIIMK